MISPPGVEAWHPWSPRELADRLAGVTAPWCITGGWALDLWHGRETRPHEDLELAVPRSQWFAIRGAFDACELFTAGDGELVHLPRGAQPPPHRHQTWVLDPIAREWRTDIFLEPGDISTWVYRRDEALVLPRSEAVAHTTDGIPYLRPELVLLFKAKAARPKDELDFAAALPSLGTDIRRKLLVWLERFHPGHNWIARLS
jgi:hypothetical protein